MDDQVGWMSNPARQQKMKMNLLLANQLCIWIAGIWEIKTTALIITTSGRWIIHEVCVPYSEACLRERKHYSRDVSCTCLRLRFLMKQMREEHLNSLKSVSSGKPSLVSSCYLFSIKCGHGGRGENQTWRFWLEVQLWRWQNVGQCLLILGMKDSSHLVEDFEVRQACPSSHVFTQTNKALCLNSSSSPSLLPLSP